MNKKLINHDKSTSFGMFSPSFWGFQSASQGTTLLRRMNSLIQTTTRPRKATKPRCLALLFTSSTPSFGPGRGSKIGGFLGSFGAKFLENNN